MTDITIDEEFKNIIPPLSETEFKQLEENIINEGCRDRIITWKNTLIDGHNRYEICKKHDIEYGIIAMDHFKSRHDVIDWMIYNQIGKRNLSSKTISYLRGLKLKREKLKQLAEKIQEEVKSSGVSKSADFPEKQEETENKKKKEKEITENLAKHYKISPATIKNDERFTNAVDTIYKNTDKKVKDKILTKEIKLTPSEVMNISKMEKGEQKNLLCGASEEVVKKLKSIKEKKKYENRNKTIMKLEKSIDDINFRLEGVKIYLEEGEKALSLCYRSETNENEGDLIKHFKDPKNINVYLEGFCGAIQMLNNTAVQKPD